MKPAPGWRTRPAAAAAAAAATAALVAVAASRVWISPAASGGSGIVGGGGGMSELKTNSSLDDRPLSTIVVVDAGSSGCRLNVYRVDGEVRVYRFCRGYLLFYTHFRIWAREGSVGLHVPDGCCKNQSLSYLILPCVLCSRQLVCE